VQPVDVLGGVDGQERLRGVLSLRDLIVASPEIPVSQFMIRKVFSVPLDESPSEVASLLAKYNLLAVPVVDEQDRIQGIVTVDDVLAEVLPAPLRRRMRTGA